MSSTNRGGKREISDYYQTPEWIIKEFWEAFKAKEGSQFERCLDPCAGGSDIQPMAYPNAIKELEFITIDIRQDSKAESKFDYLTYRPILLYDLVISNPPFALAQEFVVHTLDKVIYTGAFCAFLLRLNFLGSKKRKETLFDRYPPKYIFVHSKRPSFVQGSTDSIEYAHIVWQLGWTGETILKIL
jgi:hypothetical protein